MDSSDRWYCADTAPERAIAIAIADAAFVLVPPGWRELLLDTIRGLVAVRTPYREFLLMFLSLEIDDGILQIGMPGGDAVLDGIVRRCAQRSRFVCRECGRHGKWRPFDMYEGAVLCPRCAAPELLHLAIDNAVQFPGLMAIGGRVKGVTAIPNVLRRHFAHAARRGLEAGCEPEMDAAEFRIWVDSLKRLKEMLPPRIALAT